MRKINIASVVNLLMTLTLILCGISVCPVATYAQPVELSDIAARAAAPIASESEPGSTPEIAKENLPIPSYLAEFIIIGRTIEGNKTEFIKEEDCPPQTQRQTIHCKTTGPQRSRHNISPHIYPVKGQGEQPRHFTDTDGNIWIPIWGTWRNKWSSGVVFCGGQYNTIGGVQPAGTHHWTKVDYCILEAGMTYGIEESFAIIQFRNGDKLTGNVETINGKGECTFKPKLALENIHFPSESVEHIRFFERASKPKSSEGNAGELMVTPDTVALWHMNEGEGNEIRDETSNKLHGTIHGAKWIDGRFGYALAFDGIDDYVLFNEPFIFHQSTNATIEFWIKRNDDTIHRSIFWTRGDNSDRNRFNFKANEDGTFDVDYRSPSGVIHGLVSGVSVPKDIWTHLGIIKIGNAYSVYKNGLCESEATDSSADLPTSTSWMISGRANFIFNGIIDEVAIYNRALTPKEILSHYGGGRIPETVLLADGSEMRGKIEKLEAGKLRLNSDYAGVATIEKEWIGKLVFHPISAETSNRDKSQGDVDRILFRNGDKVTGAVKKITKEAVILSGDYGTLEIDRDKIADITFAKKEQAKADLEGIRVEAALMNGDKVLGVLSMLDNEHLKLGVRFSTDLTLARWALRKLKFNLPR